MPVPRAETPDALVEKSHVAVDAGVLVIPSHKEHPRGVLALQRKEEADCLERELASIHPVA